ncbi:MAG: FmdE family protein [Deltaproteobacteria bacterium]|jgi:formylmethanofuran dehydrogenase subunit E
MDSHYFGEYAKLVDEAGKFHGEICHGIAIGTRMTMSGLRRIGISDPKGVDRKKLMVFVEIDRCATDAIMALTGCRPGKRTMKIRDFGKMAATFINLESGKSVRVVARTKKKSPGGDVGGIPDYSLMPEEELFSISEVQVPLRPEDLPGKPLRSVVCGCCGETVLDGREIEYQGDSLCRPCFEKNDYYQLKEVLE